LQPGESAYGDSYIPGRLGGEHLDKRASGGKMLDLQLGSLNQGGRGPRGDKIITRGAGEGGRSSKSAAGIVRNSILKEGPAKGPMMYQSNLEGAKRLGGEEVVKQSARGGIPGEQT